MAVADLDAALETNATSTDGAVVRQVVTNLSREQSKAWSHEALRDYKSRALNYHLVWTRPAHQAPSPEARARTFQRLDVIVEQFFGERPLPPDVDRAALTALAQQHLAAVGTDPYTGDVVESGGLPLRAGTDPT